MGLRRAFDLEDPLEVVQLLLHNSSALLSAEVRATYVMAATKITGHWATKATTAWGEEDNSHSRDVVDGILSQAQALACDVAIEVQERATTLLRLLEFMKADLASYARNAGSPSTAMGPSFPKSLLLIQPLSSAYELNAVADEAQQSVRIPAGLELEIDIVPPQVAFADLLHKSGDAKKKIRKAGDKRVFLQGNKSQKQSVTGFNEVDIDTIPVVRLSDMSLSPGGFDGAR